MTEQQVVTVETTIAPEIVEVYSGPKGEPGPTTWAGITDKPDVATKDIVRGDTLATYGGFLNLRNLDRQGVVDIVTASVTAPTKVVPPVLAATTRLTVLSGAQHLLWPYTVHGTLSSTGGNVYTIYNTGVPGTRPFIRVEPLPATALPEAIPNQTYTELTMAPSIAAESPQSARRIHALRFKAPNIIYVGYGDSDANLGPVDIISYNIDTSTWTTHLSAYDTEAVEKVFEIDGNMVIPASDPKTNNIGTYATNKGGTWTVKTIGPMIHVFDIVKFGGKWFASGTIADTPYTNTHGHTIIYESSDSGETWTQSLRVENGGRANNLMAFSFAGMMDLEMRFSTNDINGEYVYKQETQGSGPFSWRYVPGEKYSTVFMRPYNAGLVWKSPDISIDFYGGTVRGETSHYPPTARQAWPASGSTNKPVYMSQYNGEVVQYEQEISDWVPSLIKAPTPPPGEAITVITQINDRIYYATNGGRIFRSDFTL